MREETRKKLNQMLWRERAKKVAAGLAIIAAIGGVLGLENLDLKITDSRVAGVIETVDPLVSKGTTGQGVTVGVKLDDGRHVRVIEERARDPHIGERIEITEHRHATGRVTHTFK